MSASRQPDDEPARDGSDKAEQDLVLLAHDAIAQELATAAIYAELLDDSTVAQSVNRQIGRARERMRLLLRNLHEGERPEEHPQSEPAVVADLLTEFSRNQPSVHFELSYVMDAPFLAPREVRQALFMFLREALQDIAKRAPGQRLLILVAFEAGTLRCELTHAVREPLALAGVSGLAAAVDGRLERTSGWDALIVPMPAS